MSTEFGRVETQSIAYNKVTFPTAGPADGSQNTLVYTAPNSVDAFAVAVWPLLINTPADGDDGPYNMTIKWQHFRRAQDDGSDLTIYDRDVVTLAAPTLIQNHSFPNYAGVSAPEEYLRDLSIPASGYPTTPVNANVGVGYTIMAPEDKINIFQSWSGIGVTGVPVTMIYAVATLNGVRISANGWN